jgi:cytochrome c peroxidase
MPARRTGKDAEVITTGNNFSVLPAGTLAVVLALSLIPLDSWPAPLNEPIKPLPASLHQDPARAKIGRRLFTDTRLSANGAIACSSCHNLANGGVDGRARSPGLTGTPTAVNTPSVFNAALNFRQFWDGRADSLESQIDAVVQNPLEMGSTWSEVVAKVSDDPEYRSAFAAAYKDGVTKTNIQNALGTYERTLITPNSRFDRYLLGDATAISDEEKAGYMKFKQYGCIACHQGVNVGGNMFQKFGVMGDYFTWRGNPSEADLGRYLVTGEEGDKHVFKVPSLRNVALTAPYFHDGTAKTLDQAVDVMFKFQLGRIASKEDKAAIIKFLGTLTGEPEQLAP